MGKRIQSRIKTTFALLVMILPAMINSSFAHLACERAFHNCNSWLHSPKGKGGAMACYEDCEDCMDMCYHIGKNAHCGKIHSLCGAQLLEE